MIAETFEYRDKNENSGGYSWQMYALEIYFLNFSIRWQALLCAKLDIFILLLCHTRLVQWFKLQNIAWKE